MDARLNIDFATSLPVPASASWTSELVRNHTRLVDRIAARVFRDISSAIAIEDLVQIGNIALIEAARNFVDRGTAQFSTYATIRVRGAMIDELRKAATISREALRRRRQFAKTKQDLSSLLGRVPNESEMAEKLDMALSAYQTVMTSMQAVEYTSIDQVYSDSQIWFADPAAGADEILEGDRRREAIATAIAKLPEREQIILQMFFVDECSLEEIGKVFSVSSARICQIKRTALASLRKDLQDW